MQAQRNIGSDQRGSVTILVAGAVLLAMVLLGAVQVGYVAYVKRDLQKMVDMAALSGVQELEMGDESGCAQASNVAQAIAQENLPGGQAQTTIRCGQWNEQTRVFTPRQGTQAANAIEVYASQEVAGVVPFVGAAEIDAIGVASRPAPLLVFSVGAKLLEFDNGGVLGGVLRGIGLDIPALTALSPQGIANARLSLRGLLGELLDEDNADITVGDIQQLLTADLSLAQVLDASVRAAGQNQLVGIGAQVVSALQVALQSGANPLQLRLGSNEDGRGLFAGLTAPSAASALDAQIGLADLVGTAIAVASAGRGVTVNQQVGLGNLLNVTVQAGVIEPASIGIGGTGATAYNAQVRTHAQINANVSVLGIIELALNLPITIDATSATTTVGRQAVAHGPVVEDWTCQADKSDAEGSYAERAQLSTTVSALGICIGEHNPAALFSTQEDCSVGLGDADLLSLRIGTNNTTVRRNVYATVLKRDPPHVAGYAVGQPSSVEMEPAYPLGDVVDDLMSSVLALLMADNLDDATRPSLSQAQITQLANKLWNDSVTQVGCSLSGGTPGQQLDCRGAVYQKAAENIRERVRGLGGFLSGLGQGVGAILQGVGTLNLSGVVTGLGSALTSVGNLVADIVGGLVTGILGDSCAGRNLIGLPTGTPDGCKQKLQDILKEDSGYGPSRVTNGLLVVLSETLSVLQGPLNQLGSMVLEPILKDIIGLNTVGAEVTLLDLRNCADSQDVMLVR